MPQRRTKPDNPLGERECAVLRGLADGLSLDEIAANLQVPRYIVWTDAERVMRTLDAGTYLKAIEAARENGWLQ